MRHSACLAFLLCSFAQFVPAQQTGDVVRTVAFPPGFSTNENEFAFDRVAGRFHHMSFTKVAIRDRTGAPIKELDISEDPNRGAFWNARGCCSNGATFVRGNVWTLVGSDNTSVTDWTVTDNNDGTGSITPGPAYSLAQALPANCITAFDRANDGTWWVVCAGSVYQLSPDGSAIRETISLVHIGERIAGDAGDLTVQPHLIGIDEVSNSLLLAARHRFNNLHSLFRFDLEGRVQEGRFFLPAFVTDTSFETRQSRFIGDFDELCFFDSSADVLRIHATPPADLPRVLSSDFLEEGVMWVTCFDNFDISGSTNFTLDVEWNGDPAPTYLYNTDGVFFTPTGAEGAVITARLDKRQLIGHGGEPTALLLLQNDSSQLSTPFELRFPLSAYDGNILFDDGCNLFINQVIDDKKTTWSYNGVAPREPFNAFVEFADFVPWVGGKRYGIKDVQMSGKVEIASKDDGATAISGGGAFELGSGKLRVEFGGGVLQELKLEGPELTGALATIKVAGTIQEEAGLTAVFPVLTPLRSAPLIGTAFRWLDERAKLTASITAAIDASTKFKQNMEKELVIEGEVTGSLALGVMAAVRLFSGYAELSALGEGKAALTFVPNDAALEFKQTTLSMLVAAKLRAYLLERSVQRVISITFAANRGTLRDLPNDGLISDSGWGYAYGADKDRGVPERAERPHVVTADPFTELERMERAGAPVTGPESFDHEIAVLAGLPSDATITMAKGHQDQDRHMMLAWSQPVAGKQATQATDIWYSYFNGVRFTEPRPLNDDGRMDFNPSISYVSDGVWIAAWERVGLEDFQPSGDPEADNATLIRNLRPAWAYYNSFTDEWSDVMEVEIEGVNGFNVQMLNDAYGVGGFAWLESDSGSLLPWDLNAEPVSSGRIGGTRLRYMFITAAGFPEFPLSVSPIMRLGDQDPTQEVPDDIGEYAINRTGSFLNVMVIRWEDITSVSPLQGDLRIEEWFQQFFVSSSALRLQSRQNLASVSSTPRMLGHPLFGASWEQFHVESYNGTSSTLPKGPAIYHGGAASSPRYYDRIERPEGYDPADPKYYAGSALQTFSPIVFSPAPGTVRSYVAHAQGDQAGEPNIYLSTFNRKPGPIVHDAGTLEKQVFLSNYFDGAILAAYLKSDLHKSPMMVDVRGEMTEVMEIEEAPTSTLAFTRHVVATELMPGRVGLRGGVPEAGSKVIVEAEIINPGDEYVSSPRISLYAYPLGDGRAPELIPIVEEHVMATFILGNDRLTKEFEWTVPSSGRYGFALITDPLNQVAEYDEGNNMVMNDDALLVPAEVVEWLLGRFNSAAELDTNTDGVIDSADIE